MRQFWPAAVAANQKSLFFKSQVGPSSTYFAFRVVFYWNASHADYVKACETASQAFYIIAHPVRWHATPI